MENRNVLIVDVEITQAMGTTERGYDTKDFVKKTCFLQGAPRVACMKKGSAIDGRTTSREGHGVSRQRPRKVAEAPSDWLKTVGGFGRLLPQGLPKVRGEFTFAATVFSLVRLKNLETEPAPS